MKAKRLSTIVLGIAAVFTMNSCGEKFLDGEMTEYLDSDAATALIEKDPNALTSYLDGIWAYMVKFNVINNDSHEDFSFMSVLHAADVMGEDITFHHESYFMWDYLLDNRLSVYRRPLINWLTFYTMIAKANELLDLFEEEPTTPEAMGIEGQAYAVRGMAYHYLIQLFQQYLKDDKTFDYDAPGVPLRYSKIDGIDSETALERTGRNTVKMVLDQVESDLTKAVELLSAGYERPQGASGKNYIDVHVANGLLARYYLMTQQWQKAADVANKAHEGYSMMDEKGLKDGFIDITNGEWMWGFNHSSETQTSFASFFSHMSNLAPGYSGLGLTGHSISDWLYGYMSDSDLRRKYWFNDETGSLFTNEEYPSACVPYAVLKFGDDGNWTMDYVYMRAAEMVLIEAEAYAHLGDEAKAATVLKELMVARDPSWNEASVSVNDIWIQRRIELFGEGFSYFDLKRLYKGIDRTKATNHLDGYNVKIDAGDAAWTYQIPEREITENDMIDKNEQNR